MKSFKQFLKETKSTEEHPMIDVDGVMKHRHNSEGKPIHPTDEGIRNFHRWFEGSKVVDEHGRPKVMYHGSGADFHNFQKPRTGKNTTHLLDIGFHHGSADTANSYADSAIRDEPYRRGLSRDAQEGNPVVYPCYLNIKNPADFRGKWNNGNLADAREVLQNLTQDAGMSKRSKYVQLMDTNPVDTASVLQQKLGRRVVRNALQNAGFDGIHYNMENPGDAFVSFHPNQIKSAVGNKGTFDPKSENITERKL